jgi:hypothetical protein
MALGLVWGWVGALIMVRCLVWGWVGALIMVRFSR